MIEFHGTRLDCFQWLRDQGFKRDTVGWHKTNWECVVMYNRHGDHISEVADWDKPSTFYARAWRIDIKTGGAGEQE